VHACNPSDPEADIVGSRVQASLGYIARPCLEKGGLKGIREREREGGREGGRKKKKKRTYH
jgi:hypothetical protein